jgi:hypothetical protein
MGERGNILGTHDKRTRPYTVATNGSSNFQHGKVQESWGNNNYQAANNKKKEKK